MSNFNEIVQTIAVYLIPVLFAISLHEAAHGYAARYFGDPTASNEGRLSINPIRHIDPFGTIILPLLLYFTIQVPFGYARPVPVDFNRLRNPKKQMAWVAAAGPAANLAMALGWMVVLIVLASKVQASQLQAFLLQVCQAGVLVNTAMCVFNLIPVPPLDGGRIVTGLLPLELSKQYARLDRYTPFIFGGLILLSYTGVLGKFLPGIMQVVIEGLFGLTLPLRMLLG
ncbi:MULTISPECIES: site-2 protease family protein [unclassified Janthinobacterium]|uniref:site-2 protease family protein n=1 Tax=unclassified Janthinobacterium TaxID=2610881 RepID=UPI00161E7BBC|nr:MULTISPECIES: site-2 protease family protein [unclassified Janthinobacterium]MBB5367371.1 Zn-dependent protease [Janthinobacterium sp. K2C7]MBB5380151.1 Zn-dependent protease [Janthinobacterium sp. K2Li3]MBB5385753.1 Zn-dependent protease [Janthinobacterium sp. K2E3]